jgi:hypothetical protein
MECIAVQRKLTPVIVFGRKPNNVGFDVRGDAKLFDFGLGKKFRINEEVALFPKPRHLTFVRTPI